MMYQLLSLGDDRWRKYEDDVLSLKSALEDRGYTASESDIFEAWTLYSESMEAGWMRIPDDNELAFDILKAQFDRA